MLELKTLKRRANIVKKERTNATLMTRGGLGELSYLELVRQVLFKFLFIDTQKKLNHIIHFDCRANLYLTSI